MKKHYTLIITVLIAATSITAQNLVYSPLQHRIETVVDTSFEYYKIEVTTPNPEAITYDWINTGNTFPSGWGITLCDWTTCYVGIPTTGSMTPITLTQSQNGQKGFFALTVVTGAVYGTGKLSFYVYDANDINRGDTVSWTISHINTTGINEASNIAALSFYPNPANNTVKFNNSSNENMNVEIYNSLGKIVLNQKVLSNQTSSIDVSKLNRGVYFVSSIDASGNKLTKRLILQ